jgi:mRNA interferase MazF
MMNKKQSIAPKRKEIWLVEFPLAKENRKRRRPCLVISNDIQNEYGKWIVVAGMTTKNIEIVEPFEIFIKNTPETGLDEPSKLKLNYPRTIDKERLKKRLGSISKEIMEKAKKA